MGDHDVMLWRTLEAKMDEMGERWGLTPPRRGLAQAVLARVRLSLDEGWEAQVVPALDALRTKQRQGRGDG